MRSSARTTGAVSPAVMALARCLAERAGGATVAVLFYGSALRDDALDGVLDFYVLLDRCSAWPDSRLAVLAADGIYGAIGEKVLGLGEHAWDQRVRVSGAGKLGLLGLAAARSVLVAPPAPRTGLWTWPGQS